MRQVVVTQQEWLNNRFVNIGDKPALCHGIFQYSDEDSVTYPVAVVEYTDGSMDSIPVRLVRFTTTAPNDTRETFMLQYILEAHTKFNCQSANDRRCLVTAASELYRLTVEGVK